jgi:hypothetical protein
VHQLELKLAGGLSLVGLQCAEGSLRIRSSYSFVLLLDSLGIMLNLGMDGVALAR